MSGSINGANAGEPERFGAMRQAMITGQLRTTAVDDQRLIVAMATVEREAFVPSEARELAYRDTAVPLGRGRSLNVPMATGRLLARAYLRADDRALLIGAATGYSAAVLASLVRSVVAVEVDPTLAAFARRALAGAPSVTVAEGPLERGWAAEAPYDVLVIDGAVEDVPPFLHAQISVGGRIVTGLVQSGVTRLAMGARSEHGFGLSVFADADCVTLPGFARPRAFSF